MIIKVFSEIKRVLRDNGCLYLWDTTIVDANPFVAELDIQLPKELIHTTYGILKNDAAQDEMYFRSILEELKFELLQEKVYNGHFYQKWFKRGLFS